MRQDGDTWTWEDHGTPPSLTVDAGAIGVAKVKTAPSAPRAPERVVRASDGQIWRLAWNGSIWTWAPRPAPGMRIDAGALTAISVSSGPTAPERPFVYARGTGGHLLVNVCCSRWRDLGAPTGTTVDLGAIGAVTVQDSPDGPRHPVEFVRASDGKLWVNSLSGPPR